MNTRENFYCELMMGENTALSVHQEDVVEATHLLVCDIVDCELDFTHTASTESLGEGIIAKNPVRASALLSS